MSRITYPVAAAITSVVTSTARSLAHHTAQQSCLRNEYADAVTVATATVVATNSLRHRLVKARGALPACFRELHAETEVFQQKVREITAGLYLVLDKPCSKPDQQSITTLRIATRQLSEHCEKISPLCNTIDQTVNDQHTALQRLYEQNFVVHRSIMDRVSRFQKALLSTAESDILRLCYAMLWQLDTVRHCVDKRFLDDAVIEMEVLQTMLQELEEKIRQLPGR